MQRCLRSNIASSHPIRAVSSHPADTNEDEWCIAESDLTLISARGLVAAEELKLKWSDGRCLHPIYIRGYLLIARANQCRHVKDDGMLRSVIEKWKA